MDGTDNIGVYGEAKAEYTRQLCIYLVPALEGYFLDLLAATKETEKDAKRVLWVFQDSLKMFPDWNVDKVQRETEKIVAATKCDYMEEILTAVFIAHTKVLSAIRLTSKQKKLQITIPKLDHFLHRTMSECARLLWSNAYLFSEQGSSVERQKNLREVEKLLQEGVLQSIRGMLPVKSILKEYLADDGEEMDAVSSSVSQTGPMKGGDQEAEVEVETEPVIEPLVKEENLPVATPPVTEVVDLSGATPPIKTPDAEPVVEETEKVVEQPAVPTIIVDTEPAVVSFTSMDTVFDRDHPERSVIRMATHKSSDDNASDSGIQFDDSAAPEPLDEFEDLVGSEDLKMDEGEFETL